MNRRLINFLNLVLSAALLLTAGIVSVKAQEAQTQYSFAVFLPDVTKHLDQGHSISGQVLNQQNIPVPGVTVKTNLGQSAVTDLKGNYSISGLSEGNYTITPSLGNTSFIPVSANVVIPPEVAKLNFTAQVACAEAIVNGGFESGTGWEIPNTAYPAGYSTGRAHSGSQSMRTGILSTTENVYSYSDFRQAIFIPSGVSAATASFWLYTLSPGISTQAQPEAITPTGRPFSETTLSEDVQYVLVLDQDQNWIDTLVWQRLDDGYWHEYELDLRRYAGHTIYLQFGTYNNGLGDVTSMFVDDSSVDSCGIPLTPTPTPTATPTPTCQQLMVNSKFDGTTGWQILDTAYHAGYSQAEYHSPYRSIRTGITNLADNTSSYSDFRQMVTIPSSTKHVTLGMWVYPVSGEFTTLSQPLEITPSGQSFAETALADDVQYVLILDQNQNWIDTLVWQRSSSKTWTNMSFDLSNYAGRQIILQWGTFNNGVGGVTAMYVDDVTLQACP